MPFAGYNDFDDCVSENSDKNDPDAYCAVIKRQVEGKSREFDIIADERIKKTVETDGIALAEDIRQAMRQPAGKKAIATGHHAPVQPTSLTSARVELPDLDADNPPEEFAAALEAEDFILYGKASIEQLDRGGEDSPTREIIDLSPDVVSNALERFFESKKAPGIVSLTHDDIPVGRPLREYTLEESAAIQVGDETYEFDAGETLSTHVEDGDGDGRPELWALSDLANDTPLARKVRLAVLLGDLDGYSITFGRNDTQPETGGRRVTEWDLFSWTLAPSEMVANPGAEFDLAGFKARLDRYPPAPGADDATAGSTTVAEDVARDIERYIEHG